VSESNYVYNDFEDIQNDIYNFNRSFDSLLSRLDKDGDISKRNKELILEFKDHCLARGLSKARVIMYLKYLRYLARLLDKDFKSEDRNREAQRKDIEKVMACIEKKRHAESTKTTFKKLLKAFYKWLYGLEKYDRPPEIVRWMECKNPPNKLKKEDLLTQKEIRAMIRATNNVMHKALISVLYEGSLRPEELLSMRIRDVHINKDHIKLMVRGKMRRIQGDRPVFLIRSYGLLKDWVYNHPFNENRTYPLWINTTRIKYKGRDLYGRVMSIDNLSKTIKKIAIVAGVKKYTLINKKGKKEVKTRVFPYLFRHSRGTYYHKEYGETIAKKLLGHGPDSRMSRVYNHMNEEDTLDAMRKKSGLKTPEEEEKEFDVCPKCRHPLGFDETVICPMCNTPLDIEGLLKVREEEEEKDSRFKRLLKFAEIIEHSPKIMKMLERQEFKKKHAGMMAKG